MSSSLKDWLSSAHKRYLDSKELSHGSSLKDSVEKPFESKYKAKQIINDLLQELSQFGDNSLTIADTDINVIHTLELLFHYELGSIDLDTEEISNGVKHFDLCRNIIQDLFSNQKSDENKVKVLLTLFPIVVNNQLAFIWCSRDDFPKAITYLKEAENAYDFWYKSEDQLKHSVLDYCDVFLIKPSIDDNVIQKDKDEKNTGLENVESGHTLTLYLSAQTFERMGDNSQSAIYCHRTLKRQYKQIESESTDLFDRIDWSLNAATLSQYFAINSDFKASRHHICCALKVIHNYSETETEKYRKGFADLNRIIVKYSLMLLESSTSALKDGLILESEPTVDIFRPYLLNDKEVEELEKTIKTFPIKDLSEAQQVFKYANNCLNESMAFYTLDERASDYIECIQDRSKLFQCLIPFDTDFDRQCKMQKRRIDLLEEVVKQISSKYFMGHCRQIWFELAEIYSQMADIKIKLMDDKPDNQRISAIKKINHLLLKAIFYYEEFLKSFDEKKTNRMPDILPEDYIRPILLSQFSIGRLHSKLITIDTRDQLKNWTKCEEYYVKVREYLERNPEHKTHFEEELPLLEEMLKLIPGKLQMILNSTMY